MREAAKIKALEARDPETVTGGDRMKQMRLESMREYLNMLKVQADINDPEVKRRFEDGLGMYRPQITYYYSTNQTTMLVFPLLTIYASQAT